MRLLLVAGLGYGTAASLPGTADHGAAVLALYAVISAAIAVATWVARGDVFPLTALAGSWIVISTAWLGSLVRLDDIGTVFVVAVWLIFSSTASAMLLMRRLRQSRAGRAR